MEMSTSASVFDSVPTVATAVGVEAPARSSGSLSALLFHIFFSTLPSLLYRLVSFATITLPIVTYRILTWSFTLQLNFTTLLAVVLLVMFATYIVVRYRLLTKYSRLPQETVKLQTSFDLQPDTANDDEKPGFKNYPDEFLSAFLQSIKIFGYLEQPVFHELARHLQTRKLIAGDTLFRDPEQERSFYIVVDGCVQVYVTRNEDASDRNFSDEGEDSTSDFVLLNEVRAGGTLSSLFTILSLFTEDIKLKHDNNGASMAEHMGPGRHPRRERKISQGRTSSNLASATPMTMAMSQQPYPSGSPRLVGKDARSRDTSPDPEDLSAVFPQLDQADAEGYARPDSLASSRVDLAEEEYLADTRSDAGSTLSQARRKSTNLLVARATIDTTLAVIPAEAFRRLTRKYPNAAAHIVQVILTRFQRVTFLTSNRYLGLTPELLRIERRMNAISGYDLPPNLIDNSVLEGMRRKFMENAAASEMSDSGLATLRRRKARQALREATLARRALVDDEFTRGLTSPLSIAPSEKSRPDVLPETEDSLTLRDVVMDAIARAIGLAEPPIPPRKSASTPTGMSASGPGRRARSNAPAGMSDYFDDFETESTQTASTTNSELENEVELLFFPQGSTLVRENERNVGLFFVIDGLLDVSIVKREDGAAEGSILPYTEETNPPPVTQQQERKEWLRREIDRKMSAEAGGLGREAGNDKAKQNKRGDVRSVFMVKPGGLAGYLSALSGYPSFVNICASTDTYVGYLSKESLDRIMERHPRVLLTLAKRLITSISPLVLQIDYAMEWVQVNAGHVIYRQCDAADSIYIVLNGRLRTINERPGGGIDIQREYGQGDSVGELEVLVGSARPSTLHAIRDTELARMPKTLFNALAMRHPEITLQISRVIAGRLTKSSEESLGKNNVNLKTVGLLPVNAGVPVAEFAKRLKTALEGVGATTTLLNQTTVVGAMGKHAFTKMGKLKLMNWLAEQEERARIVLYLADSGVNTPWTQTCIRQADCILLVGLGDDDPSIGEFERFLLHTKTTARKELVLLHAGRHFDRGSTQKWLKNRMWIHAHHHVCMPEIRRPILSGHDAPRLTRKLTLVSIKQNLQKYYQRQLTQFQFLKKGTSVSPAYFSGNRSDFARLARRLTGKSVGLVLGGGGARGIAHIGVLKAMEEEGIPIDMIGGTSIGAFVGGLYAKYPDHLGVIGPAKMFSGRVSSVWRQLADLTYPVTAWFTGHEFNRAIWKCFFDTMIEDMWLPYFCVTTNITWSRMEVHTTGYAWRYVRASMSLSGYMPPLCDNGNMLVDGGYMDILPVSIMKSLGTDTIFAVDVASADDTSPVNYGDSLSGWWVILNSLNPFRRHNRIPTIADIQSRLAYVSSVKQLEEAKATPGCFYMRAPVQNFGTLEFGKYDEILQVGYEYGKEQLRIWRKEGKLPDMVVESAEKERKVRRGKVARRMSI
ncbi:uncharacterized protein VTP21DRAFT_6975 [Calcarisporiella thermophila]|uniref:uncharacterized protein n=1 Tax=Calcarisporiella thermophila TaxID=911321 RepID=UPI0037428B75